MLPIETGFGRESEFHRSPFFSSLSVKIYVRFYIGVEDATSNIDVSSQLGSRLCW